ncbi:hypothetical protein DUI87_02291 [Hirundo rustica rustica]|uniref:Uncharacterized protein n=1 Tax=Hirundo rustica rustica TaxID=333673 RepID=A0A3M0L7V7_HIRRU|nr:hypothetical protein DUI87_02291 [Hirundo rustica rustica]
MGTAPPGGYRHLGDPGRDTRLRTLPPPQQKSERRIFQLGKGKGLGLTGQGYAPPPKNGIEQKRPGRPLNITSLVRLSSAVPNQISISWASETGKSTIRDLCKAHRDYGRDSPYFRGLLRSDLDAAVVIPADLKQLFSCLLDSTEFKLWVAAWRQQLREALPSLLRDPETAVDDNGNPLTLEHLMGEGRWADPSDQTSDIPIKALQIAREHAVSAFFGMVPDGPVVPYYKIMQGAKESFTKFVEQLTRAIEVQVTEVAPILVTSSRHEPYRLRLTEALYLRTADWTFLSINTKEQGAWPVQGKELVIIGDCKYTPQEVEILPGVLVNNPGDLVLWLRCTHPPTFIPKGQVIAQIIPTRGPNNTPWLALCKPSLKKGPG